MFRASFVAFLLCALFPLQGFAQAPSPPPLVPAPSLPDPYDPKEGPAAGDPFGGYEGAEQPQGELIPHAWEPSEGMGAKVPRLILESLGGLGLGFVGGTPGALMILTAAFCEDCGSESSLVLVGLGLSFVGLSSGAALGVKAGGSLLGGEGRFLPTLLGATLGTVAGIAVAIPLGFAFEGSWLLPLITLPTTGAIIAYEMTHADALESRAAAARPSVTLVPLVGVSPSGGVLAGLGGRF